MLEKLILAGNIVLLLIFGLKATAIGDLQTENIIDTATKEEIALEIKNSHIYTEDHILKNLFYENIELEYEAETSTYYLPMLYEDVMWAEDQFNTKENGMHLLFM